MDVKLVVIGGKKSEMVIPLLASRFLIGRSNRCHIRPQGDLIGDLHCAISTNDDSATLEDGGTPVGTLVNGERVVGQRPLHNGDRIKIGPLEFEVRLAAQDVGETNPSIHETNVVAGRGPEKTVASEKDSELEPTDLLLLATIIPLVGFLLSFLPNFRFWRAAGGVLLVASAWVLIARARRMNGFLWDALNVAVVFLAAMVVYLMLPADWVWQGGSAALIVALAVVVAVRIWRHKLDETNLALLAAIGILAFILITVLSPTPWAWFADLTALACLFGLSMIRARKTTESKEKSHAESATRFDELTLLLLTPILVLAVFAVGQSVPMFNPWQGG
ncbi:MAG: FHA domain-containing protein, partial [Thermoguttaceae bacterium]